MFFEPIPARDNILARVCPEIAPYLMASPTLDDVQRISPPDTLKRRRSPSRTDGEHRLSRMDMQPLDAGTQRPQQCCFRRLDP